MADPIPLRPVASQILDHRLADKDADDGNLSVLVSKNVKRLRIKRGYSLEGLAKLSGVSRAMLSQIELGRSVPTINIVFKIARAFDVPFSALLAEKGGQKGHILPASESKTLTSASGAFSTRALFPLDTERKTEFYELRLAAGGTESADPHPAGTLENLVVVRGLVEITTQDERYRLAAGDAVLFQADALHSYRNPGGEEALVYLVMTYPDSLT